MTYEKFEKLIDTLKEIEDSVNVAYKININLLDFVDPYHKAINDLLEEVYGIEGSDWISWYCYEGEFGAKELEAFDADGNPICYDLKSLWEHVENLNKQK